MTSKDSYYQKECNKIDASCINAYLKFKLDDQDPSHLILENSWEDTDIDLEPAVKDAETLTHLFLSPEEDPEALQYNPERGEPDCIHGDDLSRIISLSLLKDVDQNTPPVDGDVLIYRNGKWYTFNLTAALAAITNRLDTIEQTLEKPEGIPANSHLVWGNINLYSDYTNSNIRDWGFYTHNTSTNIPNDEFFA